MATLEPPTAPLTPLTPTNGTLPPVDGPVTPTASTFDPALMRAYLLTLLPAVFGTPREELEDQIVDSEFEERVTRFAGEGGGPLYVVKVKDEAEGMCQHSAGQCDGHQSNGPLKMRLLRHTATILPPT